jgi:Ni/Co efflux regulator RcnB
MAMRTFLIAVLLAGVATPSLAARPAEEDRGERRVERSEARESAPKVERSADRPQRIVEPRNESFKRSGEANRVRTIEPGNVQSVERVRSQDADTVRQFRQRDHVVETTSEAPRRNFEPKAVRPPRDAAEVNSGEREAGDTVRNWRARERNAGERGSSIEERVVRRAPVGESGGDLVQSKRPVPRVFERSERRISRTPVLGTEPPAPRTATAIGAKPVRHWRTDWRHDRRYDWRNWRRRHHSHFHFGFYSDPFGWDYFRYGIGWRLWPSYYRNSFWLNDPWHYRLPPAYGPYRWIRYFNDALLVNIYTGQVVDVEYNIFW